MYIKIYAKARRITCTIHVVKVIYLLSRIAYFYYVYVLSFWRI